MDVSEVIKLQMLLLMGNLGRLKVVNMQNWPNLEIILIYGELPCISVFSVLQKVYNMVRVYFIACIHGPVCIESNVSEVNIPALITRTVL